MLWFYQTYFIGSIRSLILNWRSLFSRSAAPPPLVKRWWIALNYSLPRRCWMATKSQRVHDAKHDAAAPSTSLFKVFRNCWSYVSFSTIDRSMREALCWRIVLKKRLAGSAELSRCFKVLKFIIFWSEICLRRPIIIFRFFFVRRW